MKLYVLEFENNAEYSDYDKWLLGIYSSEEEREKACKRYLNAEANPGNIFKYGDGYFDVQFVKSEIELDKDLYKTQCC